MFRVMIGRRSATEYTEETRQPDWATYFLAQQGDDVHTVAMQEVKRSGKVEWLATFHKPIRMEALRPASLRRWRTAPH